MENTQRPAENVHFFIIIFFFNSFIIRQNSITVVTDLPGAWLESMLIIRPIAALVARFVTVLPHFKYFIPIWIIFYGLSVILFPALTFSVKPQSHCSPASGMLLPQKAAERSEILIQY